ncbi:GDSL-type esterase/lipase family protein [Cesiribacter andamanensis]|uniref:Argininosuccinate lyase n=1 Tax=Cesiribacter andamanensis AMV16 TaxID=1279009 RepID=M7NWN4_9BACT|nr:GDSL-type esterase/lipase family protein [Cesiribacter andamanensis]EMR02854.1 Argininosuccinate lyase [Cesiribacter andamanensis AMV16]
MKRCMRWLFALLFTIGTLQPSCAQQAEPPFWSEIQAYKEQDRQQMPPAGATLFVGSSSIRLWHTLAESFPQQRVLNRGFGGSTLQDLERYLADIVLPYKPGQIVIYSGENDIAAGGVSAQEVLKRFERVFTAIRQELPRVPIVFISLKPSPSRLQYQPLMQEANALIRQYLDGQPQATFVDIYTPMLNAAGEPRAGEPRAGEPRPELFVEDQLHMNEEGYRIWAERIRPVLK